MKAEDDVPLGHLTDEERQARQDILAHFEHIEALGYKPKESLEQLIREIAFTHLNRLCAYKMMEVRDVYVGGQKFREAVSKGLKSQGFLFYLADHPEDEKRYNAGDQEAAYRHFLDWLGGTLSQEIGVLFSPTDPANRLYPPQRVLDEVLDLLNSEELKGIWSEDETIGWVYQYFTPKELRDQARKESQAPRNSYELAFRNQFFTPRYVVEFLTDNTLGRIWYEMRKGDTRLKDECRYMVRRPTEVFLDGRARQPPEGCRRRIGTICRRKNCSSSRSTSRTAPRKTPERLKILDPACGSGHFLLYCFDLLLIDLRGSLRRPRPRPGAAGRLPDAGRPAAGCAWPDPAPQPARHRHRPALHPDRRPRPLAAVPAGLSGDGAEEGPPQDHQSNIVCAEPMPGEKGLLDEFLKTLREDRLEALIRQVLNVPRGQRVRATKGDGREPVRPRSHGLGQDAAGGRGGVAPQDRGGVAGGHTKGAGRVGGAAAALPLHGIRAVRGAEGAAGAVRAR